MEKVGRTAVLPALWVLTAVMMVRDWSDDPYDPLLEGTRRYGHNSDDALANGLVLTFLELAAFVAILRPWSYDRSWRRALVAVVLLAPWTTLSMVMTMHAGGIAFVHFAWTFVVLVGLVGWMETARVTRAAVLAHREREFVLAARALGASPFRVVAVHLLPLAAPAITVAATLAVGRGILLESTLSFFGVGVQPPTASWGNMLYQAQSAMTTEPWLAIFPGACIFATAAAINAFGERRPQA